MEIYVKHYREMLLAENLKQNLISRKAPEIEFDKHVQDSLALLRWCELAGQNIIDIGSGAGFPGLVLAMAQPDAHFTLLEADLKKSSFLTRAVDELELKNVLVLRERAEVAGRDPAWRGRFSFTTARAVAKVNSLVEYGVPFLQIGGTQALWKGPNYQEELDEAAEALGILCTVVKAVHLYSAQDGNQRVLLLLNKSGPTPEAYPRKTGIPTKRPL